MWTSTTMTIGESLVASAMGFLIVFLVLIFLALVIIGFAKFFGVSAGKKKETEQPAAPVAVVPEKDDSEIVSIVTSVICEELKVQPHELKINGIREV